MLTDGQTDDGVTGILIAHLGAFGSGELIITILHYKKFVIGPMLHAVLYEYHAVNV